jgi:hypothetical protein
MMRQWREREFEKHLTPTVQRSGLKLWGWLAQRPNCCCTHGFELVMGHGDDDGIVRTCFGLLHRGNAVFRSNSYHVQGHEFH